VLPLAKALVLLLVPRLEVLPDPAQQLVRALVPPELEQQERRAQALPALQLQLQQLLAV
jgi:hypothetical protein